MSAQQIAEEAYSFREFYLDKKFFHAGQNAWLKWIEKPTAKPGGKPAPKVASTSTNAATPKYLYAKFGTPQLDAWDSFWRKTKGGTPPRDRGGGSFFLTEWPPGYVPTAAQAPLTNEDRRAAMAEIMARQAGQVTGHHAPAPDHVLA